MVDKIREAPTEASADGHTSVLGPRAIGVPSQRQMSACLEVIDPEQAQAYLGSMHRNRAVRPARVEALVRAMKNGEWRVTSQGIGFDAEDRLIDGQHRMRAIIESGLPQAMVVVRGLDSDSVRAIDDNTKRSFADDLRIEGRDRNVNQASFATMVLRLERAAAEGYTLQTAKRVVFNRYELREALERYTANDEMERALDKSNRLSAQTGCPPSAGSAAYYLARHYLGTDASSMQAMESYFEKIGSGLELLAGEPAQAVHHGFNRVRFQEQRPSAIEYAAALLYGAGFQREGRKLNNIRWNIVRSRRPVELLRTTPSEA